MIRTIEEADRNQTIELINQFFRKVNQLDMDGLFQIRPRAGAKYADIYLKLSETDKVYTKGYFAGGELVSLLLARVEEKPHLVEERSMFIDLAVTKQGHKKKGYMSFLLKDIESWCSQKKIPTIELRALLANEEAISYWDHSEFERFYIRYRKKVTSPTP